MSAVVRSEKLHTHTYIHTQILIHTHRYTQISTHTHTYICARSYTKHNDSNAKNDSSNSHNINQKDVKNYSKPCKI
jgi:hypothetical protein